MRIGQAVLVRHQNIVAEGRVEKIFDEDLNIKLNDGTVITRKYWETRTTKGTSYEKQEEK